MNNIHGVFLKEDEKADGDDVIVKIQMADSLINL
mgnify:CR=1 FL=1